MTRSALPKLRTYATLAAAALIAAIAFGRPELVALGAPFALFLAVGIARLPAHQLIVTASLPRARAVEGDELILDVEVAATTAVERLEIRPQLPAAFTSTPPRILRLREGERRQVPVALRCRRWGAYRVGALEFRAFDRFGLIVDEGLLEADLPLRVYPGSERLRHLLLPLQTQPFAGNQVARSKGDGIEFADIGPFTPGDRVRRINWRASARRQSLYVNESHPERNADVVLFLDSFAAAQTGDESTLDRTVRAAASLTEAYLRRRDRVGIVGFGGIARWLTPSSGVGQLYRIIDSLLETEIVFSYAPKTIDVLPRRSLPPQSLVLALTPLLDNRAIDALVDLRRRGFDLAIIEIPPTGSAAPVDRLGELPLRLWRLSRDTLRYRYERLGVPVIEWHEHKPLTATLQEATSFRRHARQTLA